MKIKGNKDKNLKEPSKSLYSKKGEVKPSQEKVMGSKQPSYSPKDKNLKQSVAHKSQGVEKMKVKGIGEMSDKGWLESRFQDAQPMGYQHQGKIAQASGSSGPMARKDATGSKKIVNSAVGFGGMLDGGGSMKGMKSSSPQLPSDQRKPRIKAITKNGMKPQKPQLFSKAGK